MAVVVRDRLPAVTFAPRGGRRGAEKAYARESEDGPVPRAAALAAAGRNDALDGLRFVAVAAVMAFHFGVPGAQAGFLGVDLFFVLSGYLITRILLKQVESGRVNLPDFWTRRVRRLAPAVLLALAVTIAWGALEASMTMRDDLRGDITATLAYVANWHFISSSTYFEATGDQSPLLHMWTLAVEEQFYVLWPITLFLIAVLVPARARLTIVAAVAATGVLVSAWRLESLWIGSGAPDRAYMGTDSRMFGPLFGALVAIVIMRAPHLGASHLTNTVVVVMGSAILVWAMFALGSADGPSGAYPRGGAVLVALGSAALIWGLATRASPVSAVLALAPFAYLGRISYGIYIWHWPLIIWAGKEWTEMDGFSTVPRVLGLTAAIVAVAALSYHAVEKPIRYGTVGRHLSGRWVAVLLPAALCTMIAVNTSVVVAHAGAEIAPAATAKAHAPVVTKTVILVGDSVPQLLSHEFADAAAKRGYVGVRATSGGCPATAVGKVLSSGAKVEGSDCARVAAKQDAKIKAYRPALVIWWSRYELAPRLGPDGKVLPLGSNAYFHEQQAAFDKRVRALTRLGARLVTVQIEPPGPDLAVRNPEEKYFLVGQTLLHRPDVVKGWNAFLARHKGPKVFSISIDHLVCHDTRVPCDDRLPNGESARPDGVHYSNRIGPRLAPQILAAAMRVAHLTARPTT
jgi:peptidoglycan/LPS O-acetylase OafA/YrhL